MPFLLQQAGAPADAIVLGRRGSGDGRDDFIGVDAGDVILQLGRPLLLVPPSATQFSAARVVIAWKTGRELRRAWWPMRCLSSDALRSLCCAIGAR